MDNDFQPEIQKDTVIYLPGCGQGGVDAFLTLDQFRKVFALVLKEKGKQFFSYVSGKSKCKTSNDSAGSDKEATADSTKAEEKGLESGTEKGFQKVKEENDRKREEARLTLASEEDSLVIEQATYNLYKKREHVFQTEIQPSMSAFHKIMDELIYFAGCSKEPDYGERKTLLLNKQELLRADIQSGMWDVSAAFNGIINMRAVLNEEPITSSVNTDQEENKREEWTSGHYKRETVTVEAKKKEYAAENEKLSMDKSRQCQCLEYVCLLKAFYPIVEEICDQETMDAQWTCGIAEQLEKVVAEQQCEFSTNMKFCWVHPDDDAVKQSKQLQLQFRAAEVDCPGLYYRDSNLQDQYVCVVPGCAK